MVGQTASNTSLYYPLVVQGTGIFDIADAFSQTPVEAYRGIYEAGLLSTYLENHGAYETRYAGLERLVLEGTHTKTEIGARFARSTERIRQLINERGLEEVFNQARLCRRQEKLREAKEFSSLVGRLHVGLLASLLEKGEGQEYVQKAVFASYSDYQQRITPFSSILEFFRRYYEAKHHDEQNPVRELVEGLGISIQFAGRLLSRAGEKPLLGSQKTGDYREMKQAVIAALSAESDLCLRDRAYFLDVPEYVFSNRRKQMHVSVERKGRFNMNKNIPYRRAAEFYWGVDNGMAPKDAAFVLDILPMHVDYLVKKRGKIQGEIDRFMQAVAPYIRAQRAVSAAQ